MQSFLDGQSTQARVLVLPMSKPALLVIRSVSSHLGMSVMSTQSLRFHVEDQGTNASSGALLDLAMLNFAAG